MRTPDPNDHWWNRAEASPNGHPPGESVTEDQLRRRLEEALSLLRVLREGESRNRGRRPAAPDLSLPTVPQRGGC